MACSLPWLAPTKHAYWRDGEARWEKPVLTALSVSFQARTPTLANFPIDVDVDDVGVEREDEENDEEDTTTPTLSIIVPIMFPGDIHTITTKLRRLRDE